MGNEVIEQWWHNLVEREKQRLTDKFTGLVGTVKKWDTLKFREIVIIYNENFKTN